MSSDPDGNILLQQVYKASTSIIERGDYASGSYLIYEEEMKEINRKAAEALGLPVAINLRDRIKALKAENARLREALRPFAKSGEIMPPRKAHDFDMSIYAPAAGAEYSISGDDLRRALEAMKGQSDE